MIIVEVKLLLFLVLIAVAGITLISSLTTALIGRRSQRATLNQLNLSLFDCAPFGVIVVSKQGRTTYQNEYAKDLQLISDACSGDVRNADTNTPQSRVIFEQDVPSALNNSSGEHAIIHSATLPDGRSVRWWMCGNADVAAAFILDVRTYL
ncbi:MAG: hypothetical protein KatS3mg053_2114 [Candidatus Roseilinea sp.]|nr:MAG: hypothetical protein KatS3mg053_2114 [Candidatus Roseilinea sp.]